MGKVLINKVLIRRKLNQVFTKKRYVGLAYNAANLRYQTAVNEMRDEFDGHTVTQELEDGNTAGNESGTLGFGNLFSFLGFPASSKPTEALRYYLFSKANLRLLENPTFDFSNQRFFRYEFTVKAPDLDDVYEQFPMPGGWSDMSWVEAIEDGVEGLGAYVYHEFFKTGSRSKTGLQVRKGADGSSKGIAYVSKILRNFRDKFE